MTSRLISGLAILLLFAGCTNTDPTTLESFVSNGVDYEFGIERNQQGPNAPCVGITSQTSSGSKSVIACPTKTSEENEYAAVIDFEGTGFVVGFGLDQDEIITVPDAIRIITTETVDSRRFFLIQLPTTPGPDGFDVGTVRPDGTVRTISTS